MKRSLFTRLGSRFADPLKRAVRGLLRPVVTEPIEARLNWLLPQLITFHSAPRSALMSAADRTKNPANALPYYSAIADRLGSAGVQVEEQTIDPQDFKRWLEDFPEMRRAYEGSGDAFIEKCLEHYLTFTYLGLDRTDVFIDVAAGESPWASMLRSRLGIKSFRLDLSYRSGIHGTDIGADAGNTALPPDFCSAMALHCAFECFMGEADVRFIREASRILNARGRYAIVPLYLDDEYFVGTSPWCDQRTVEIDPKAVKLWRDDGYHVPFSRHYSPEAFAERIWNQIPGIMTGKVILFKNLPELMAAFPGQRIYCYLMFKCDRRK